MGITANVLDMYHGDDNGKMPDFAAMKEQGIWAIIHKASQGLHSIDPLFRDRARAAHTAGLLVGAYHFLEADNGAEQAKFFTRQIYEADVDMTWCTMLAADFEKSSKTPGPMALSDFVTAIQQETGLAPVIYGGDLVRETLHSARWADYRLWLAEYGPHERVPPPWKEAWLWQFSETGTMAKFAGHVDLNFYAGTQEQLAADWGSDHAKA